MSLPLSVNVSYIISVEKKNFPTKPLGELQSCRRTLSRVKSTGRRFSSRTLQTYGCNLLWWHLDNWVLGSIVRSPAITLFVKMSSCHGVSKRMPNSPYQSDPTPAEHPSFGGPDFTLQWVMVKSRLRSALWVEVTKNTDSQTDTRRRDLSPKVFPF